MFENHLKNIRENKVSGNHEYAGLEPIDSNIPVRLLFDHCRITIDFKTRHNAN